MRVAWLKYYKEMISLALPVIAASVVEALIPFINTAMAAHLGEQSLAAAGLVGSTFFGFMAFCWGIIISIAVITANKIGSGADKNKTGITLWAGFITAVILGLPLMFLFAHAEKAWIYLGQDLTVSRLGQYYFNGLLLGVIADLAKFVIYQFAIACNKPRLALIPNIISVPLLIICNLIFIKGWLGLPKLGIFGIGLGTALTYWIIFIGMLIYLLKNRYFKQYLLYLNPLSAYFKECWHQFRLGLPMGLMMTIEVTFFMVLALLMGHISIDALAAHQIAVQSMWVTIMLTWGATEATTILVGKANGAKDYKAVLFFTYTGTSLAIIAMLIVGLFYWFTPAWIIHIYLSHDQFENIMLVNLAEKILIVCGIYQLLDAARIIISGALRGTKDTSYPMWISLITFWLIALPLGYGLAYKLYWGAVGFWWGLILATVVGILLLYWRLQNKFGTRAKPYVRKAHAK